MVLGPVPPVPVAALRDQDFLKRQPPPFFSGPVGGLGIEIPGVAEIVPGAVVFGSADPYIEICLNPRSRNQRREPSKLLVSGNGVGNRDCFHPRLALERVVETAQELAARPGIILPRVLAIQDDRNDRIMSCFKKRLRRLLDVMYEVVGGL